MSWMERRVTYHCAEYSADCIAISIPFAVRTDAIDLSLCPDCGGRLRVIADVTRPDVIQRI